MSQSAIQKNAEPSNKRGLARQQKFLETAEEMFLTQGYASTSVNEVVRLAGGSLVTLYRMFGNKLGLFEAVFRKKTMTFFNELEEGVVWSDDIERSLLGFGEHMQSVILRADGIAIYRLVLMENNADQQEIQRIYYKYGPQVAIKMLANYLDKQVDADKVVIQDTYLAAAQFMEMIKGPFVNRLLFGEVISEKEVHSALLQGVQIFMKGISK
ncbi:TetR/AcrR family transcriptional regulator [Thiomicrorhabdus lithotrophica]|uniref:TetR/AcrR family transcriptional regulator n=1 Tax=Thiomicrorhabdus lithotrophica TaxID=2949997 RepID=A0ABY8CFY0_9GAMM|nr:TetR/AcrR family transcriptional regulator [Thiomicrorhabdus lithotrophica]WEJ63048.1 TetR/AcrR family transcriptional regulator [Thiomicrorhabdus lithotrophica]